MRQIVLPLRPNVRVALASLVALLVVALHPDALSAKTPDGVPPSQETVCSALSGAAFGLCNAYCEAQDCDVHPRPSCAQLRRNFMRVTGSTVLPCDVRCGDGTVSPPEQCDPPGSTCGDGGVCAADCSCRQPVCGDKMVDPGEDCDPPGSPCANGQPCSTDCTCRQPVCGDGNLDPGEECDPPGSPCPNGEPCTTDCTCPSEPVRCCECPSPMVCTELPPFDCRSQGCEPGPPGTACDPFTERCVTPPPPLCCQCGATVPVCFDATTPDQCTAQNCTAVPTSTCGANGVCL